MPRLRTGVCLAICLSFLTAFATNFAFASETSSGRWVIWSEKPAEEWEHGLVTGNGRHGARVMGHPRNDRIICNHEELFTRFWDRKIEMVADIAHLLPEVRRLIDEGEEKEAYTLANDEAKKQLIEKDEHSEKRLFHIRLSIFILNTTRRRTRPITGGNWIWKTARF